jgi:hypothetical protein
MRLTEVFAKLQGLEIFENRTVTDDLVELVFENKQAKNWHEKLEAVLGPALKPEGASGNSQANQLTKAFGGIRKEQTLYYKTFGEYAVMAMFWPWGNGKCTSCKIYRVQNLPPATKTSLFSRWFKK